MSNGKRELKKASVSFKDESGFKDCCKLYCSENFRQKDECLEHLFDMNKVYFTMKKDWTILFYLKCRENQSQSLRIMKIEMIDSTLASYLVPRTCNLYRTRSRAPKPYRKKISPRARFSLPKIRRGKSQHNARKLCSLCSRSGFSERESNGNSSIPGAETSATAPLLRN